MILLMYQKSYVNLVTGLVHEYKSKGNNIIWSLYIRSLIIKCSNIQYIVIIVVFIFISLYRLAVSMFFLTSTGNTLYFLGIALRVGPLKLLH